MIDINEIFEIKNNTDFEDIAIKIFRYQAKHNKTYRKYINLLKINPSDVSKTEDIPFLPVSVFKKHKVVTNDTDRYDAIFTSSGTTSSVPSKHYVKDIRIYEKSFIKSFEYFYGSPENYVFLALLPSYLERSGSSLIYMMKKLIELSQDKRSGFYLNNHHDLNKKIQQIKDKKIFLLGVTYALLDFAEHYSPDLSNAIVMETGGMKGRRKEMIREEVHEILKQKFNTENIHSEYGMTELLSQAYSHGNGIFTTVPWTKILIRDIYDPFDILCYGKNGGINIIDLANINSCAFIETQDIGNNIDNNRFTINGRIDNSDIRGCNLMVI